MEYKLHWEEEVKVERNWQTSVASFMTSEKMNVLSSMKVLLLLKFKIEWEWLNDKIIWLLEDERKCGIDYQ